MTGRVSARVLGFTFTCCQVLVLWGSRVIWSLVGLVHSFLRYPLFLVQISVQVHNSKWKPSILSVLNNIAGYVKSCLFGKTGLGHLVEHLMCFNAEGDNYVQLLFGFSFELAFLGTAAVSAISLSSTNLVGTDLSICLFDCLHFIKKQAPNIIYVVITDVKRLVIWHQVFIALRVWIIVPVHELCFIINEDVFEDELIKILIMVSPACSTTTALASNLLYL